MVPEIKKILYTTDMSDTSNYAFGYAASLANRYDALITIFHVLKNPRPTSDNLVANVLGKDKPAKAFESNANPPVTFGQQLPSIKDVRRMLVEEAMKRADNNKTVAARLIGITRQSLSQYLQSAGFNSQQ